MAEAQFYIVYIERREEVSFESVKKKMDNALDWYRIGEEWWFVYTTSDADKWHQRLSPIVKDSGSLFICRLDSNDRQGWMTKDFWNWLRRKKDDS